MRGRSTAGGPTTESREVKGQVIPAANKDIAGQRSPDPVRDLLGWAQLLVLRKCGPHGVDFVEIALREAIATHDGKSSIKAWALRKIPWVVDREMRSLHHPDALSTLDRLTAAGDCGLCLEGASATLDAGNTVDALRAVDDLAGLKRWLSLAAALGRFAPAQTSQIVRRAWLPDIQTPDEAIDAAMLFGGSLWQTRAGFGGPAIEFSRKLSNTRAMAWMMLVLERHERHLCRFSLASNVGSFREHARVIYRTRPHKYFASAYRRWYGGSQTGQRVPAGCLTDATLTCWLTGRLLEAGPCRGFTMRAPGLTEPRAKEFAAEFQARSIGCTIKTDARQDDRTFCLAIDPLHRPAAEQWLDERVPRFVWE